MVNVVQEIQGLLELPEIDRKATRSTLRKVFAAYRQYKVILNMLDTETDAVFVPARTSADALSGYEESPDPKLIHAPYRVSDGPVLRSAEHPQEAKMRKLCYQVEKKVYRLPDYQREIILRRYLITKDPQPNHEQVWSDLVNSGWYVSFPYYEKQEAEAMYRLAYGLRLEQLLEAAESDIEGADKP